MELDDGDTNDNQNRSASHDIRVIAHAMGEQHGKQKKKQKLAQDAHSLSRHAHHSGIPAASTGLGKSLLDWVKAMLGITPTHPQLPPIPTPEEIASLCNYLPGKKALMESHITATLQESTNSFGGQLGQPEEAFIKKTAWKEMDQVLPPSKYHFGHSDPQNVNTHSEEWISYGHALLEKSGFQRCTFHWDQHHSSTWNTSMKAVLHHSWKLCHQNGGTMSYTVEDHLNTTANCLGIINRWLSGRKAVWKKQISLGNPLPDPSPSQVHQPSKQRVSQIPASINAYMDI